MPRSPYATRPRRTTLVDRWLNEELHCAGECITRGELIQVLKSDGMDDRCVDRYLQGVELRMRLAERRRLATPLTAFLQ